MKKIALISKKKNTELSQNKLASLCDIHCFNKDYLPFVSADLYINWGNQSINPKLLSRTILNRPESVRVASNKLLFFKALKEEASLRDASLKESSLEWTESKELALEWLKEGFWIVSRSLLRGSNGRGAVVHKDSHTVPTVPLYTKYFKKKEEYRYHIFLGKVIFIQKKKRLSSSSLKQRGFSERPSSFIRNLLNGYIYSVVDMSSINPEIASNCIKVVNALSLDFGAVDVLVNNHSKDSSLKELPFSFKICEVNTAPGLQGSCLKAYSEAINFLKQGE